MDQQMTALMQKLEALVAGKQAPPANGSAGIMPAGAMGAGAMPGGMGFGQPFGQPMAASFAAAPTGVSVPLNVVLGDGSELTLQLHFGPEHAANLAAFVQMVAATYGPLLKTYRPRFYQGGQGGHGGGGFGGYQRGYQGGYGGGNNFRRY